MPLFAPQSKISGVPPPATMASNRVRMSGCIDVS
jgi:hypothetical protein